MAAPSRRLVIDASLASAAGRTLFPDSFHSREFLDEVLKISHRIVMTPELAAEWDRHESLFAARWRAEMRSRKKIVDVQRIQNQEIRTQVRFSPSVLKDLHLVEAALVTDRIVVSLDERARTELRVQAAREIVWVNAVQAGGHAIYWLRSGAPDKEEWKLGRPG